MVREQIRGQRGCCLQCPDRLCYLGIAVCNNQDVLITLHSFLKWSVNLYRHKFEKNAGQEELLAMPATLFRITIGTDHADPYNMINVGSHMEPLRSTPQLVVHAALARIPWNWWVV